MADPKSFSEWADEAMDLWEDSPTHGHPDGNRIVWGYSSRLGQFLFNELYWGERRLDITEKIRGTMADPFYMDDRIPAFLEAVGDLWGVTREDEAA